VCVGLGVRVAVGPGVRLGAGVWDEVGVKVEVETRVTWGTASVVRAGLTGALAQEATMMENSTVSTTRFKRSRPRYRSRGGSNP
jgi:hypothetical protein